MIRHLLLGLLAGLAFTSCATGYKPCSAGGDINTNFTGTPIDPKEIGNSYCLQKKGPGKTFLNHGRYQLYSKTGVLLGEGEFQEGLKEGTWIQYDMKGEKVAERIFLKGVDKTPAPRTENYDPNADTRPRFSDDTGPFAPRQNGPRRR